MPFAAERAAIDAWRREKERAKAALRSAQRLSRKEGRCACLVRDRRKPGQETPAQRLCDAEAVRAKRCTRHYLRDILKVRYSQPGNGVKLRPFAAYRLPIGSMSDIQHELMADLERLPVSTSYEECIARMNAEDPSSPLILTYQRPTKRRK